MKDTKPHRKPTIIVRSGDALELVEALRKLTAIYRALGLPEDAKHYEMRARIMERQIYGGPKS
jgi:hypothetical protein